MLMHILISNDLTLEGRPPLFLESTCTYMYYAHAIIFYGWFPIHLSLSAHFVYEKHKRIIILRVNMLSLC